MFDVNNYDSSWSNGNDELYNFKFVEWEKRDWEEWLNENLNFPFEAEIIEDDRFMGGFDEDEPFTFGHKIKVQKIEYYDEFYGILLKCREGRRQSILPLCNLEVTTKKDPNYWPVLEFCTWFANK